MALIPFEIIIIFLDHFLGSRIFSIRNIKVVSIISIPLVISSVLLLSIINNDESKKEYPWEIYTISLNHLKEVAENKDLLKNNDNEMSRKIIEKFQKRCRILSTFNSPSWQILFTIASIIFYSGISLILVLTSLIITRNLAREMIHARGVLTLSGGFILNLLLLIITLVIFTSIITLFGIPIFWPFIDIIRQTPKLGLLWGIITLTLFLTIISAIGWYLLIPSWTKIIIMVSLIPWIAMACLLVIGIVFYLLKKPLYSTITRLLRRSLEWHSGPLAYIIAVFTFLTALITFLTEYLF